jgi:hypothetical protein
MSKNKETNEKWLELGDIIHITAPTNPDWHDKIFFISYIDPSIIEVISVDSSIPRILDFLDIQKIAILERSSIKGYAKQNGLYPHIWVDLYFGGETPRSITAEITNLEEDMIELTTYPENQVLYIDFAYQGVPRNIPLEKICVREKPASFRRGVFSPEEGEIAEVEGDASMEYLDNGYIQIVLPKQFRADENYNERLQKLYKAEPEEDEELEEIVQQLEIPAEQQQYGLEAQVNDLLDAFLSTIPDYKRTPTVMNRIYTHIQRFKELREKYSIVDPKYNQIVGVKRAEEQPFVNALSKLSVSLPWCIPVVSQTNKIFDDEDNVVSEEFDVQVNMVETDFENETKIENDTFYKNKIPQNLVKYANMFIQTASVTDSFEPNPDLALHQTVVKKDMDVIVSNDDDFNSHAVYHDLLQKYRFRIQRYNQEIRYTKDRQGTTDTLFPADSLAFRSLVVLPEPFIAFSKIKLPNTNLLSKINLHAAYPYLFTFLNKRTDIQTNTVMVDEDNVEANVSLQRLQHFVLSSIDETAESMDSPEKLDAFLKQSIPQLKTLVDSYLLKQKNVYSFIDAVDRLEPFLIYIENITWKVTNTIKQLLYKNIDRYNTESALKSELYKSLILEKYKSEIQLVLNGLLENTLDKKDIAKLLELYDFTDRNLNSSEWIKNIHDFDQGKLYTNYLKRQLLELYTPDFLLPELEENDSEKDKDSQKCWKRVIVKKYTSFNDLKDDNNHAIEVDKGLDTTNYSLVEKYKKENPDITEDEFIDYWSQTLTAKHGFTMEHALSESKILFDGKKMVGEGEYAVLEEVPKLPANMDMDTMSEEERQDIALESNMKKRTMYFVRKKNVWEHDTDLDEFSFVDPQDLLCNLKPGCLKTSRKTCESEEETLNRFKNVDRERIRKEFESRYEWSKEDYLGKMELEETKLSEWMEQEKKIQYAKRTFIDAKAYEYGKRAVMQEFIESPYVSLRDAILQKNLDFVTKQQYIVLFVEKFCREPIVEDPMRESPHWKYCKETNVKLMPTSLFQLAKAYESDLPLTNNIPKRYNATLNRLCNTVGKLSDDGDAYIDKYSGYILRKIELREEGFEMDMGSGENEDWNEEPVEMAEVVIRKVHQNEVVKVYTNEVDQRLYNIISTICRNMYIHGEENKEKMMQLCGAWLKLAKLFPSESTYKAQTDQVMKKREQDPKIKIPDSFEVFNKKRHIAIAALSVLIVVQTAIPEIPIDRTFSGCVKSFTGYPLKDGQDDLSSITYLACVLRKIYSQKEDANLVPKAKGDLENLLLKYLKDPVLLQPQVLSMYDLKRAYLLENPLNENVPKELEVDLKWPHFLPPVFPISIPAKQLQAISPGGQTALNVFLSKVRTCSLAVVQYIREMVSKKNVLFQTKSGFPFLQNACCDEPLQFPPISALEYFWEDPAIEKMVGILNNMSQKIAVMQTRRKAWVLLKDKVSPSEKIPTESAKPRNIIHSYEPALYYAALIHYCKLDSEIYPIPVELETFCNRKPTGDEAYNSKWSIAEKMAYLEKHQIRTDAVKTIELMNVVNRKNQVSIMSSMDVSYKQKIQTALEQFQSANHDLPTVFQLVSKWIEKRETAAGPGQALDQEKINYSKLNEKMKSDLLSFISRNASVKLNARELNAKTKALYAINPEIPISNIANYMKFVVYRFGIVYPAFLQSENMEKKIPKHWELLFDDVSFLKKNTRTYMEILKPYIKHTLLSPIFENCIERIRPLFDFMEYATVSVPSNEYYELGLFVVHCMFLVWIGLIDNPNIYKIVTRQIRENVEEEKDEMRQRSNSNSQLAVDEADEDILEVDITSMQMEQRDEMKQQVADLFLAMISTLQTRAQINAKEPVMMSYADIMREVDYSRDREKQRLKDRFKKMDTEERKAEMVLKKLHLGAFAVDMKNINKYGKNIGLMGEKDEEELAEQAEIQELMELEQDENENEEVFLEEGDGDSNLDEQGEEEDYDDMNEYAYDNYFDGNYD